MIQRMLLLVASSMMMVGAAYGATDLPVVMNPFRASEGFMFDWIFFAIMIPIPAFLYFEMKLRRGENH